MIIPGNVAISADGSYVAFASDASNLIANDINGAGDIFRFDTQYTLLLRADTNTQGAQGNANSDDASISGDGQIIAFASLADNLLSGDTNGYMDIFCPVLPRIVD